MTQLEQRASSGFLFAPDRRPTVCAFPPERRLFFLAVAIWTMPLIDLGEPKIAQAVAYRTIDDVGWLALGGAGVGAGLMVIGASLVALRTKAVAAWAGWLGVAAGVASFATVTFVGMFAWLGWILVVAVALLAGGGRST